MVVLAHHHLHLPLPPSATRSKKITRTLIRMSSSASQPSLDFPYLPAPQRSLMASLLTTVETHLAPLLLPPSLPPDVQRFQSPSGTSKGALHIQSGQKDSSVSISLSTSLYVDIDTYEYGHGRHKIYFYRLICCWVLGFTVIFRREHRSTSPPSLHSLAPQPTHPTCSSN